MKLLALAFLLAVCVHAAERQPVVAKGAAKPVGPYTPGISAGDFFYVSGQGARDAQSQMPDGIAAQTRQCMENVKAIVEAAGLTMEHIVYTQIYLADINNYDAMNQVYTSYFKTPPARSVIGVARMPTDTPVEISAVAIRSGKRSALTVGSTAEASSAIKAGERAYISGVLGRRADTRRIPDSPSEQVKLAVQNLDTVLKQVNLKKLDFANIYITEKVLPADVAGVAKLAKTAVVVTTTSLPMGANVEITGFVAPDLEMAVATGTTEDVFNQLKSKLNLSNAVVGNVYIDDIDNFVAMNKVYASFFPADPPTRTTVQPTSKGPNKSNMISIISTK